MPGTAGTWHRTSQYSTLVTGATAYPQTLITPWTISHSWWHWRELSSKLNSLANHAATAHSTAQSSSGRSTATTAGETVLASREVASVRLRSCWWTRYACKLQILDLLARGDLIRSLRILTHWCHSCLGRCDLPYFYPRHCMLWLGLRSDLRSGCNPAARGCCGWSCR